VRAIRSSAAMVASRLFVVTVGHIIAVPASASRSKIGPSSGRAASGSIQAPRLKSCPA
jgi:hypothetical protein